jgi:long-chain acyl-CoA synthetase
VTADLHVRDLHRPGAVVAERGRRLAGGLARLGLSEGDVVAVLLRNDPVFADVIEACRVAGVYYCALNWHFTPAELGFVLRDSGAKALIGHADLLAAAGGGRPEGAPALAVGGAAPGAVGYEAWLADQPPYAGPAVSPRGHMGYTSGTTGRPKGVRRFPVPLDRLAEQQARMRAVVAATLGIVPGCRALVSAPLYHSAPTVFAQQALAQGERLVLAPRFDAAETLALIERHRVDVAYLVPTMYVRLLRLPEAVRRRHDLSSLRFVASTGAPCAPEVKRAMIDWLGPVITETYASTESGMVTAAGSAEALAKPGTAGRPVGGAEIRILDGAGRPRAPGEVGTVYVRQPAYPDFTYHNLDAARRAIERDGYITLGDVGYLDEEGYLFLCDRAADMVVSGGVNIYPAEVEHALLALPGVLDCAVFGTPDAEFGERLHAVVQPAPGAAPAAEALAAGLRARIAGYKVPRSFEFTDALPRDPNGKIAKRRLRERHWQGQARRI